jgi:hypothetical protein
MTATNVKLPDFVIVGAPKCGTTSLHHYLAQHPDVFLPAQKELHFFSYADMARNAKGPSDAHVLRSACATRAEYEAFFADAGGARAVGEVSPSYFYYADTAAERMRAGLGEARIVALVRDPIEKAWSQYMHLIRDNREPLSFPEALAAEEQRTRDGWAALWRYAGSSLYMPAIERYRATFGAERVKVLVQDDLRRDTRAVVADLFDFIGVDAAFEPDTGRTYHRSGAPKSKLLANVISKSGPLSSVARAVMPDGLRTRVRTFLQNANTGAKGEMDEASRDALRERFADDVAALERLLGRELGWMA